MNARMVFVVCAVVLTSSCARGVDKQKLEALYHAGKAVEGALSVGVTYIKFGELVQTFATEVSIGRDKASNESERELVRLYAEALQGCQDSLTVWKLKLAGAANVTLAANPELKHIADTYPIQGRGTGMNFSFGLDGALQAVWSSVGAKLAAASYVYSGESPSDTAPTPR